MKKLHIVLAALLMLGLFRAGQAAIEDWTDADSTNTTVDSVSIAENMPPSDVNNAMREILTETAKFFKQYVNSASGHDKGSANAYAISPAIIGTRSSVISGAVYRFKANATNTSTQPTLSVSGETGITIQKLSGAVLDTGDIVKDAWSMVIYDGTNYQLLNPHTVTDAQLSSVITTGSLQNGPTGSLFTFDGSNLASFVTPGTSGQVLTSRGNSSTPVFQTFSVSLPVREMFIPISNIDNVAPYGSITDAFGYGQVASGHWAVFTFSVPPEFTSLDAMTVVLLPDSTETVQFDIDTNCAAVGEQYDTHSDSATNQTKSVTIAELAQIDVSSYFSGMAASDYCGLKFSSDTDTIGVLGLKLRYNWE